MAAYRPSGRITIAEGLLCNSVSDRGAISSVRPLLEITVCQYVCTDAYHVWTWRKYCSVLLVCFTFFGIFVVRTHFFSNGICCSVIFVVILVFGRQGFSLAWPPRLRLGLELGLGIGCVLVCQTECMLVCCCERFAHAD